MATREKEHASERGDKEHGDKQHGAKQHGAKEHGAKEHGEGNYKATRDYNERTKRFMESGKAEQAGRRAEPRNASEAADLEKAEQIGKSRAKEEDPALEHDKVAPKSGSRGRPANRRHG